MMNRLRHFIDYRPLSILAMGGGVRDIILGIGFLVQWSQITQTLIFQNYNELIPGFSGFVAGVLLVLGGLVVVVTGLLYKRKWLAHGLRVQAMLWMFSTLMYTLNGHFALACIFGLLTVIPAGYISYYVKYNPARDQELQSLVDKEAEPR